MLSARHFKNLSRRTTSCKVLRDKAFNMAKNTKYEECQRPLTSVFYNVFDKKPSGANTSCSAIKNRIMPNR